MRLHGSVLGTLSVLVVAAVVVSASQLPTAGRATVIRGGTVIDVESGALQPNSIVVIEGDRISAVGPADDVQVPAGANVIEAAGKFILPGLWDSHAHTRDYDGDLNINHGVTSTMDMGNLMDWVLTVQEAREKQEWVGPRVYPQGMSIGGKLGPHQWAASTPAEAAWSAQQNIEAGVNFLKIYSDCTPEMIEAVVRVARAAGMNVVGHLGRANAREAVLAGLNSIAHGTGIAEATAAEGFEEAPFTREASFAYADPAKFDDLIALMVERDVRMEPNFVNMYHGVYPQWDAFELETLRLSVRPELHYIRERYEMYARMWHTDFRFEYPPPPALRAALGKSLANQQLFTRRFAEAGGRLLVGTDNYYHAISGLAVWHEMELLADAGVAPLKILQAATINAAEFVNQEGNLGTIAAGKLADLIILGRNPLEDVRNIRSLETVIQHGTVQALGYESEYRIVIPRPYLPANGQLPQPYISSIEPSAVPVGTENLVLTIKGRAFDTRNRVLWDDTQLQVLTFSPTELTVAVPSNLVREPGTRKVHMITGGRVQQESLNFQEVMVTFGRRFEQRWNGQTMSNEF